MIKKCLLYFLCLYSVNTYGQRKTIIDICTVLNRAAAMAFKIPSKKCSKKTIDSIQVKKELSKNFEVAATVININSYYVGKYDFIEVAYKGTACDTVAVLFIKRGKDKFLYSKPYSINKDDKDFRVQIEKGVIILYRKIKNKSEIATASFEFNMKKFRLDSFVDDGFSIW